MTIRELRILPPLVIGRVGSAPEPLDSYTLEEPARPLGFRRIVPTDTLIVEADGTLSLAKPRPITFKDEKGRIRPVAPFLEVHAVTDEGQQERLTLDWLKDLDPNVTVEWRVDVANRKVERRTGDPDDRVTATADWFADHEPHPLQGRCPHFIPDAHLDFGHVRYIAATKAYPDIRLRFTPAAGLIYGPADDPKRQDSEYVVPGARAIYDANGSWSRFHSYLGLAEEAAEYHGGDSRKKEIAEEVRGRLDGKRPSEKLGEEVLAEVERLLKGRFTEPDRQQRSARLALETQPPSLYAMHPPAPCWLNDGIAFSRGYLDDTCDGIVEVRIRLNGRTLTAVARICSGPPAVVPDTLFIRTLADDLDQAIFGPKVPGDEPREETRARALDIVRRSFETVRFLNVAVANGEPHLGQDALDFDTMPAEEAFQTLRMMRPIMAEGSADTLAIMALHQEVYAALLAGAAPWFPRLLRSPNDVGDFTDHGRRRMPAMMCGADGGYLALTYRQITAIFKAASLPDAHAGLPPAGGAALAPRNATARRRHGDVHHRATGNPFSSTPRTSVANCTPGLELDLRAVWRRLFQGIVLREWDNLVVGMEDEYERLELPDLKGHRLLAIQLPRETDTAGREKPDYIHTTTQLIGPSPEDPETRSALLVSANNPRGLGPLEWSNTLARVLHERGGEQVTGIFTPAKVWEEQYAFDENEPTDYTFLPLTVRPFYEDGTAVISRTLAEPGELTQGLCSPWQNDYRECSCYYWASARPDYVNVEPSPTGGSTGDNWLQKVRSGDYVPDTYEDARLISYDDLFANWETLIKFQVGGRDVDQ
ncbi:MAG: hypothetical protein ABI665_06655 [Vicinamibacterales bacterium]